MASARDPVEPCGTRLPRARVHRTADWSRATATLAVTVVTAISPMERDSAIRGACHPKSTRGEPRDVVSPVRANASSSTPATARTAWACVSSIAMGASTLSTPTMRRWTINGTANSATMPGTASL